ncbi:MAG: 6-phosphogluconolactonase [Patescibacteria group bacterium]
MNPILRHFNTLDEVAAAVARPIAEALRLGRSVLWLVPGGSGIAVAAYAAELLNAAAGGNLTNLAVTLTDERYGPVDHPDSNWRQLRAAGFMLPSARLIPVLDGANQLETTRSFAVRLEQELAQADFAIGLFGIGADGHTAGILPHSPAVGSADLAYAYDAGNFRRITITPRAIGRLSEIVVYAQGPEKWPALARLSERLDPAEQPAQALKQVKKLTVFSDYRG